jgi:ubiquinone/menaquinone biosynthesis C-methylase UbiE
MRWHYVLVLLGLGCARPNPAEPARTGERERARSAHAPHDPSAKPAAHDPSNSGTSGHAASDHRDSEHGDAGKRGHSQGYHLSFSDAERFARHFDDPERDAWQRPREVVQWLQLSHGQAVADLGAGTGYFISHLSNAVGPSGTVLALDVEPNMIRYLERRASEAGWQNVKARVVAPDDAGLAAESVDRILIVNTWHHIDDRTRYATKLAQSLKPGGFVLVVDFTRESDIGPPPAHRISAEAVVHELSAAALDAAVVTGESLPKQYVVRAARRQR